nr:immunoglobulin light chain junction region [Macaca mulatta]
DYYCASWDSSATAFF